MRAYRADTAFDGEAVVPGGALVLVEGDRIVGVERGSAATPADCEVVHMPNATLLPGLVDAHVHLCADGGRQALDQLPELSPHDIDQIINRSLRQQLTAGVTAVRDLGDHEWAVVERSRTADGRPTVVAAGPPITSIRGHCSSMGGAVAGADQLRRAVRERAERGADVVKVMASGGAMTPGTDIRSCQFTLDEVRLVVEEAHRLGLPVTAHAHGLPAVEQCLNAEVDGIEHCSCLTAEGFRPSPGLAERLAGAGTNVCPTLGRAPGVEPAPQVRAMMERHGVTWELLLDHVAGLQRAGVRLVGGSDAGISPPKPHGVLPEAVIDLAECGMDPTAALAAATSVSAAACGLAGRTGKLRPGLDADLLIVDGDATRDLTALRQVRMVVSRGRPVS